MVVLREPGEVFLLAPHVRARRALVGGAHRSGHPRDRSRAPTISPAARRGRAGIAAHANGSLYVVFGNHAHRLAADLRVLASRELPPPRSRTTASSIASRRSSGHEGLRRRAPGPGSRDARAAAGRAARARARRRSSIVARCDVPEPSIARLSADGDTVYVGRDVDAVPRALGRRRARARRRRSRPVTGACPARPTAGTRCSRSAPRGSSTTARAASATRARSAGRACRRRRCTSCASTSTTGAVSLTEICGLAERAGREPAGRRRRPPHRRRLRQRQRGASPRSTSRDDGSLTPRWRRDQNHACHPLLFADTGELVTNDHDAIAWPTRSSCSTSKPATSACGSTPGARCSRCSSRPPGSTVTSTTARSRR